MMRFFLSAAFASLLQISTAQPQPSATVKKQMQEYLTQAAKNGYSGNVLVASRGTVLVNQGFGWADREKQRKETERTVFDIGSITKQFTAAGILKLEEAGRLTTSDSLALFFPDAPKDKRPITLHQLLTHTAGIEEGFYHDYELISMEEMLRKILDSKLLFTPGAEHRYSNAGYTLLAIIIEKVSGLSYEAFLQKHFFQPLGMVSTGYIIPKYAEGALAAGYKNTVRWGTAKDHPWLSDGPSWSFRGAGGVLSTLANLQKWYKSIQMKMVLSSKSVQKWTTGYTPEGKNAKTMYAYGWSIDTSGGRYKISHDGGNAYYDADFVFYPKEDLVIVVSNNVAEKRATHIAGQLEKIFSGTLQISSKPRLEWEGTYRSKDTTIAVHFDDGGRAQVSITDSKILALFAIGSWQTDALTAITNRSDSLAQLITSGDIQLISRVLGMEEKEARFQYDATFARLVKKYGPVTSVLPLGTVSSRSGKRADAYVEIRFQHFKAYLTITWSGNTVASLGINYTLNRSFVWQKELDFYAATSEKTLRFVRELGKRKLLLMERQRLISSFQKE